MDTGHVCRVCSRPDNIIIRSEILENSDCMGNAVSLAERLMMPPSHMRASIQYRQSGTIEKGNVHVTPVMNGKRLLAFDALKSEIRAKRVEPLREIKSRDFKKTVAVAKANIDEQERNVDQMSDVRPAVMASEATVDGTGTPHARMIPAGSVLQAPRIVRSGKPVSAVRAARRAKGKSGKPAEITQSGDTAGAHVVDQPSREEDKTNNMDEVDISQEKQMHTKPV
ncbi:hypothetical protein OnM2_021117 [Erysiphe neolycopersici]|uniref:Uncharacterized protein n=1 Tax=Erysiphe neolycopersici TaxID=212602 RepID=A0A420I333_9PEZI|nr:hypothetical protein OnM2_021117 [Erysiphe neolycopersici]